jgi:hypothetical protein
MGFMLVPVVGTRGRVDVRHNGATSVVGP